MSLRLFWATLIIGFKINTLGIFLDDEIKVEEQSHLLYSSIHKPWTVVQKKRKLLCLFPYKVTLEVSKKHKWFIERYKTNYNQLPLPCMGNGYKTLPSNWSELRRKHGNRNPKKKVVYSEMESIKMISKFSYSIY